MKKKILFVLVLLALVLVGCNNKPTVEDEPINQDSGNWVECDGTIGQEEQAIFDKAIEGLDGVSYQAVALLEKQVVAGTNYKFLCNVMAIAPEAVAQEKILTIYCDLEGNCTITNIEDMKLNNVGGWSEKDEEVTAELQEIIDKATGELMGAKYKGVKLLGTQVVAGTNYRFLCDVTTVTATPETTKKVLVIYCDLAGNCQVTSIEDYQE